AKTGLQGKRGNGRRPDSVSAALGMAESDRRSVPPAPPNERMRGAMAPPLTNSDQPGPSDPRSLQSKSSVVRIKPRRAPSICGNEPTRAAGVRAKERLALQGTQTWHRAAPNIARKKT